MTVYFFVIGRTVDAGVEVPVTAPYNTVAGLRLRV